MRVKVATEVGWLVGQSEIKIKQFSTKKDLETEYICFVDILFYILDILYTLVSIMYRQIRVSFFLM